jgi:F0F1-type ATP synthase membrane subunit b/b'
VNDRRDIPADPAADIGAAIREQVEAVLEDARNQAARIEAAARTEAEQRSRKTLEEAQADADRIREDAREEASRAQQQALDQAANVAERAHARLLKHVDATEQELRSLLTGLRRDAESLGRD